MSEQETLDFDSSSDGSQVGSGEDWTYYKSVERFSREDFKALKVVAGNSDEVRAGKATAAEVHLYEFSAE